MTDIERLFAGDRPVPGMRSKKGRGAAAANVPSAPVRPEADTIDVQSTVRRTDADADTDALAAPQAGDGAPVADSGSYPAGDAGPGATVEHQELAIVEPTQLRPGPQLAFVRDPGDVRNERMRLLRTELLLRHARDADANAVVLLGAGAGEGRSVLAAELALCFAQLERPTLLVDVDFRQPRQNLLFGAPIQGGLAQALAEGAPAAFNSVEGFPSLAVVLAGVCPPNPLDLLMDWRFESQVREWRREFEFIVIDTPPISEYPDAIAVATVVGRVLLVNRARHTRYKDTREMLRRLSSTNAEIVGSVLNHF